ncbi:Tetratricopeptide repeat (TPR)-like superfamily protein [Euphorbia peplus]|nr:Tetratricopeptide repeat (TPR)-like superfamily protein [Euphorbia peplus]
MAGLAMYGHGEEAIKLFQEMEESGARPDGIMFISLLYACSHADWLNKDASILTKWRIFTKIYKAKHSALWLLG